MKAKGMRRVGFLGALPFGLDLPASSANSTRSFGNSGDGSNWHTEAVSYGVSALLVLAAILKSDDLSVAIGIRGHRVVWDWFVLAAVQWEIFLASWLLSRIGFDAAYWAAVTTFSIFASYSLLQVVRGVPSCGCFGRVEVDPRWSAMLDLCVLGIMLRWARPNGLKHRPRAVNLASIASLAAMVWSVWVVAFHLRDSEVDLPGKIRVAPNAVLWEPEKWIGTRLPILDELDVKVDLTRGSWQIVLVRRSCRHCEEFVANMLKEQSYARDQRAKGHLAVVDLDKQLPKKLWRCLEQSNLVVGTIKTSSNVLTQVPTVIMAQRGIAVEVR